MAEPCPEGVLCRSEFTASSSVALRAVWDACLTFGGVEGFCLFVFFFPPPSSFCRLSARVHLGISLLLNELLVQEGGSEVPSGLGGDGGGGRGDVLFHMQSAMNWGKKQQKTHGNLFNKIIRVRAASGVADIVGEKPFKNEIKVELFF